MKTFIKFFGMTFFVFSSCFAIAQAAAQTPAFPASDDRKAIEDYLAMGDSDARLKMYDAYFQKAIFTEDGIPALVKAFAKDLDEAKSDRKIKLAGFILTAVKRNEKVKVTGKDGVSQNVTMYFTDVQKTLHLLSLYGETAPLFYKALPFPKTTYLDLQNFLLDGKRAAILVNLFPKIASSISIEGKQLLLEAVLAWPSRLKDKNYDIASLRALQKMLEGSGYPFITAVQNAGGVFESVDWKAFIASMPDDDELTVLLPGLLGFKSAVSAGNTVTPILMNDAKAIVQLKTIFDANRAGSNNRLKALVSLIDTLQGVKGDAQSLIGKALESKDDWVSFCLYRAGILEGGILNDDQFLSCIDPLRPSLASAALEDRYSTEYLNLSGYRTITISAGGDGGAEALKAKVIAKCLTFKNLTEARIILPVMNTIVFLGETKYIINVFVFTSSPNKSVRESAYRGLLRHANSSMLNYFLRSLSDSSNDIRYIGIAGLGAIKDSRGVDALSRILNDPAEYEYLRSEAAISLGKIGDRKVTEIFKNVLLVPSGKGGDDLNIRIMAAQNLGEANEKTAVTALLANINPTLENRLNYCCLEALGKIDDPAGFKKLIPIIMKGWEGWLAGTASYDNLYTAAWALFLFSDPSAEELFAAIWDKTKSTYNEAGFMAAYYLTRNQKTVSAECIDYVEKNRPIFFKSDSKAYEFARLLKKRWDMPSLLFLAGNLSAYSSAVQSWILSCMEKQINPAYVSSLAALKDSPDTTVRIWVASIADGIGATLVLPATTERLTLASDLDSLLDSWDTDEADKSVLSWLKSARTKVKSYLDRNTISL